MKQNRILLSAGGTGGHVFPALATAYELAELDSEVVFTTDIRGQKYLENKSFPFKITNSASPSGGWKQKITFAFKTAIGVFQALNLIRKFKPHAVVGFGGYPSFPTILATRILGKKIIIHEQNSVLGKTNLFLMKYADIVATSFEETKYIVNADCVGNPVRAEISAHPYPENTAVLNILITGGSQGAKYFSEIFPDVFDGIENIFVTQQAKEEDVEEIENKYQQMSIGAEVKPFFDDIEKKIAQAHLVICRSGSSTIAEIAVIGRPAIFIPLPSSADNHQVINAEKLVKTGGAWIVQEKDLDKESFNNLLKEILGDYEKLNQAAKNIVQFAKPDAAKNLAKLIVNGIV